MHSNEDKFADELPESVEVLATVCETDDAETVTESVTTALHDATGTDETDLEPLYTAVDPDALDSLFGPQGDGTPRDTEGHVVFDYGPYRVRVESDGTALVYESE